MTNTPDALNLTRNAVHTTIKKTLNSMALQYTHTEDGDCYPLVDALTPDGGTVDVGRAEIDLLTDAIYLDLLAAAPQPPALDRDAVIEACARTAEEVPLESFATEFHMRQTVQNRLQIAAAIRAMKGE